MTGDCRNCRDWRGCDHDGKFFTYADIQWCALQNFWLLKFANILEGGDWPTPEIIADLAIRGKKAKTDADFVKSVLAIGEVNKRLTQTGWRGRLLAEQCINRETLFDLDYDVRQCLYYVSGWKRRDTDFNVWRAMSRYRKYNKVAA
jgi:hypothetical protein